MTDKPTLNNARVQSFGTYVPIYDIQIVDVTQKIFKGRPVPVQQGAGPLPGGAIEADWIYFTSAYDDRNDWDRLYHEFTFDDTSLIGQPFKMIPKEKLLFKYCEPPGAGIVLPNPTIRFDRR